MRTRTRWKAGITLGLASGVVLLLAACASVLEPVAGDEDEDEAVPASTPAASDDDGAEDDGDELSRAQFRVHEWPDTDFEQRSISLLDIMSGGPPRDGIPSIDEPRFVSIDEASEWLSERESVQVVDIGGDARAYPVQILMWHEIVNDTVGGQPVAITYCPLCNTAIVFDRDIPDVGTVEFGTTGTLYNSALVMYDRTTESWFWQVSGEAVVGELTGFRLTMLPSMLTSFEEFHAAHPEGQVLSRETGHQRDYGRNPYEHYDRSTQPFLFQDETDERLSAMERVVTVELGGEAAAFPFSRLLEQPVVHHTVSGQAIVVFYREGAVSPLDSTFIAEGRDIGSTSVFIPRAGDQELTFEWDGETFRDQETDSTWNLLGEATGGPLAGERLEPVVHGNHFWFSWAVYQPDTEIVPGS